MKITIVDLQKKYFQKIDHLDLDLIMAHVIKKPREFVMAHPEHKLTGAQIIKIETFVQRRVMHEPLAYILGHKEFYGLNFKVTPDTLIPRPETELLVELATQIVEREMLAAKSIRDMRYTIYDIGTGSGNIIISLAKNAITDSKFFGIDISTATLKIAKQNAKINEVLGKIKFIHGSLLDKIKNIDDSVIITNLPYLSQEIYSATLPNVKKFEPKSALYSPKEGLSHYEKLFKQIAKLNPKQCTIFLEISPEQKTKLPQIIKTFLPKAKIEFKKDLANKWRVCRIEI